LSSSVIIEQPGDEPAVAVAHRDALTAVHLAKSFGATRALRDGTLSVAEGEIHALVGENGSGKSTLVKLISGIHRPDGGSLSLHGRPTHELKSPAHALELGVATVHQEVLGVGSRSVLHNLWMGNDGLFRRRGRTGDREARARSVLDALGCHVDLDVSTERLSLSERQAIAIARALLREPRMLILDEATSALDVSVRDRLFAVLRERAGRGSSVIFISHRMDEIAEIADRVTVMRSGETVATLEATEAEPARLVELMTGGETVLQRGRRKRGAVGEEVLSARGIQLASGRRPIDLTIRAGEIVGLAGLEGHGQDTFLQSLWTGAGEVEVGGHGISSAADAFRHGVVYVPRERRSESLFGSKSITENFALPTMSLDTRGALLSWQRAAERFASYEQRLSIRLGSPQDPISTLSGGNQQKVVLARWLAASPSVVLLNDPTRGIDHGTKLDLYDLLRELAKEDLALVVLSTEVDEHIALMDRVLVFRDHEVTTVLEKDELTRERLVGAFFGEGGPR
jgi:ABC-type sugar transport system ATPase subunit